MPRIWKYFLLFLFLTALLSLAFAATLPDDQLHLVFCDVGQGDAILIYQKTTQILVDGGPDSKVLSCLSSHMPFWDRKIELIIVSHTELDHIGGLVQVVKDYKIDRIITSGIAKNSAAAETLAQEIEKQKIPVLFLEEGNRVRVADIDFAILWPMQEYIAENAGGQVLGAATDGSVNQFSLVLRLSYGNFDALLTGDIVPPSTDLVAEDLAPATVLKVPHHGSKNGLTEKMLTRAKPELAVISVGKNNRYGHPHKETMELLEAWRQRVGKKFRILRTDLNGEIIITTNGQTYQLKTKIDNFY